MSAVGYGMTLTGKSVHLTLNQAWALRSDYHVRPHEVISLCGRWLITWIDGAAEAVAPHCCRCTDILIGGAQNRRVDKGRPET